MTDHGFVVFLDSGNVLLSRAVSSQVPSALKGLTAVFGMGTGGSPSPSPPETLEARFPFSSRGPFLTLSGPFRASSPKGRAKGEPDLFPPLPLPPPLGEVSPQATERAGRCRHRRRRGAAPSKPHNDLPLLLVKPTSCPFAQAVSSLLSLPN